MYFHDFIGNGMLVVPDGRKIKGAWHNGVPVGKMLVDYPNQSIYYGVLNSKLQKDSEGYIYFKNG
jgi:endo-beta-N-acetylglucosaminidase D